jgi:Peptidase S46
MKTLFLLLLVVPLLAEEGMWTFDNFPAQAVKEKYGFEPTQQWLDKVRLASIRYGQSCSASIVSPNGLVMTNHHCVYPCVENVSSAKADYAAKGFYARTQQDEVKCPAVDLNQLVQTSDVTADITSATKGKSGAGYDEALKAAEARIEKACSDGSKTTCEVVRLYGGGRYHLYRYRRYDDVRLVFAPEEDIAAFGGDPDNFMFPRYDLDVSFVRIYENGAPASTPNYFKWSQNGVRDGSLTFMSGNPGKTEREKTVAELEYERDYYLPSYIAYLSEYRGTLTEFQTRGPEQERISGPALLIAENSLKVYKGRREALVDALSFKRKVAEEQGLRKKIDADEKLRSAYGQAWSETAKAVARDRELNERYLYLEKARGFKSKLFTHALDLVRAAEELSKPNESRLSDYTEAKLPRLRQSLASTAPIYKEFEIETLTFSLTKLREALGPDDAFVKQLFGKRSPREIATEVIQSTHLTDPTVRKQLLDGGKAAIAASTDPMIHFARLVDPETRAIRTRYEHEVEAVYNKNSELIGRARFAVYGSSIYPDATLTLRLTYGAVKGWNENGRQIAPFTYIGGAFARNTGREPFRLPESWIRAQSKLNPKTPMNFVSTNDIIGGNSGSPVIDQNAEIVGIVFDGNIHSLGGDYWFDETSNRAVTVDSRAIAEVLDRVYGASRVLAEIRPGS